MGVPNSKISRVGKSRGIFRAYSATHITPKEFHMFEKTIGLLWYSICIIMVCTGLSALVLRIATYFG